MGPCESALKQARSNEMAAEEKLRELMRSVSRRKQIWRRYRESMAAMAKDGEDPNEVAQGMAQEAEILRDCFGGWRQRALEEKRKRIEKEKYMEKAARGIRKWALKQEEARQKQAEALAELNDGEESPRCRRGRAAKDPSFVKDDKGGVVVLPLLSKAQFKTSLQNAM